MQTNDFVKSFLKQIDLLQKYRKKGKSILGH